MTARSHEAGIPRLVLRAAMALVVFALVAVLVGRQTGTGLVLTPQARSVETRALRFEMQADNAIVVKDNRTDRMVALLAPEKDGFIRGVLRGLVRGRAVNRIEGAEVYALTRWSDGRLSVDDTVTGDRFDLNSFGADNLAAFARLLESREGLR